MRCERPETVSFLASTDDRASRHLSRDALRGPPPARSPANLTGDGGLPRWLVTASTSFGRIALILLRERDMRCRVETTVIGLA
jgi:hypothetical protein